MNTQTINISLPKQLVKIIDEFSKKQFSTRSDLIRIAIIRYISEEKELADLFFYGDKKAKELKIKEKDIERIIDDYRQSK